MDGAGRRLQGNGPDSEEIIVYCVVIVTIVLIVGFASFIAYVAWKGVQKSAKVTPAAQDETGSRLEDEKDCVRVRSHCTMVSHALYA